MIKVTIKTLTLLITATGLILATSLTVQADEPDPSTPGAWIIYPDATPDHWVGNDRTSTGADPHTSIHEALGYSGQLLYPGPNNDDIGYWEFYNPPPEGSIIELRGEGIWQIAGDGAQGGDGREKQKSLVVQQNNITIRGLNYDPGDGSSDQQEIFYNNGATTALFYLEASNITIENLHITGTWPTNGGGYALAIGRYTQIGPDPNATGLTVTGNTFNNIRAMFDQAPTVSDLTVVDNFVNDTYYNIFKYGVTFTGNNSIINNSFNHVGEGKTYHALHIYENTGSTYICNNTFNGWRSGKYAIYAADCTNPITICATNTFVDQVGDNSAAYNYYPLTTNFAVGFEDQNDYVIPVELTTFSASVSVEGVAVSWATATETENLGFYLYRSDTEGGDYEQINAELIPGAGNSDQANTYSYTDSHVEIGNTYYYKLADVDFGGNVNFHGPISVAVEVVPTDYALQQNYPNPFNPMTSINFAVKEMGNVSLRIYDLQGRLVRTLVETEKEAGSYSVMWNGTDDRGNTVASGTYLYTLTVNDFEETRKLVFMK